MYDETTRDNEMQLQYDYAFFPVMTHYEFKW